MSNNNSMADISENISRTPLRHIFLTGPPGIGKTTLVQKILETLKKMNILTQGFYTEEKRQNGVRIGFDIIDLEGNCKPLARITSQENAGFPKVGKYSVDVKAFESLALPAFDKASSSSVLILDEIGGMELFSDKFKQRVNEIFKNSNPVILATIPIRPNPFVNELRKLSTAKIFTVTVKNRYCLEEDILEDILEALAVSSTQK